MNRRSDGDEWPVLAARSLSKHHDGVPVLASCDLELHEGETVALMGASGAGKSTLLHCLAGVLVPDVGEVWFRGERLSTLDDGRRSDLRLRRMGLVFQSGDLVPDLSLLENVMLPLLLMGERQRSARRAAIDALERLGVAAVADHRVSAVSGGQAQRAAVARAVVHRPDVVLADEPTGPLDTVNAEAVLDVLTDLSEQHGTALLVVTHDNQTASHLDRLVTLRDATLVEAPAQLEAPPQLGSVVPVAGSTHSTSSARPKGATRSR